MADLVKEALGGDDSTKRKPSGMNPERLKELQKQADAVRIGGKGTARRKKKVGGVFPLHFAVYILFYSWNLISLTLYFFAFFCTLIWSSFKLGGVFHSSQKCLKMFVRNAWISWLIDWLIVWMNHWLIDWLIGWMDGNAQFHSFLLCNVFLFPSGDASCRSERRQAAHQYAEKARRQPDSRYRGGQSLP